MASLILDASPVARFQAQEAKDISAARSAEQFFTYLFIEGMHTTYPVVHLLDHIAWHGHAYVRENWEYITEREARVICVDQLFPDGLETTIEAVQTQEVQSGEEPSQPQEIIIDILEAEYDLDQDDPVEEPILIEAANKILEGNEFVKIVYRRVLKDQPSWQPINPINVICPQNQDPETAEFVCIIHEMAEDTIRSMGIDGHLSKARVDEFLAAAQKRMDTEGSSTADMARKSIRDIRNRKVGVEAHHGAAETGKYTLWEIYARIDINGDGERERAVVWYAPQLDKVLGILDYVFPFDTWPITYFPFEAACRPVDNYGIAEKVKTFQRLVNSYHNARIDAAQIMLAPVMQMRAMAGNYKRSIKWHPGAIIPVQQIGDLQPVVQDLRILAALLNEEQSSQRIAETYIGVFDATLTNMAQSKERRTATEVSAIQGLSGSIFGLDAKIFQVAFSRSATKIWQLYEDLGEEEMYYRVLNERKPRIAKKSEICKNYDIVAAGTPANTNKALKLQAYREALQTILMPAIIQSGRLDWMKLIIRYLTELDYNMAKDLERPVEESAAVQQILGAAEQVSGQEPPPI